MHLIPSIPKPADPKAKLKSARKPADMLQCPRCAGREVTPTVLGAMLVAGKLKGGTTQYICTGCMLKGERVVVTSYQKA